MSREGAGKIVGWLENLMVHLRCRGVQLLVMMRLRA
jgi:hypothetical protein